MSQYSLPAVGCTVAFKPCSECYEMILRDVSPGTAPGGRHECHNCRNVIVTVGIEKNEEPVLDRFRPFEPKTRQDDLADILFDDAIFNKAAAEAWLEYKQLAGFAPKGVASKHFLHFAKSNDPVHVYVRLDRGVLGRLTSREVPHRFSGASR